ncbi:hypothetical protein K2173_007425 [Erythroxylum novogranatense]|uniref:Uncharacterized protein n=1 Tax=Erythroxylum novogranatense TaxID=1862640 RepID=A0AAV8T867_9ROSI|nr:hypothetical protein K2173_007425 [Erythroxylum novogranatense]
MDSEEEFPLFSDAEKSPSPVPARKLKRLRKSTAQISVDPPVSPSDGDAPSLHATSSPVSETRDSVEKDFDEFEAVNEVNSSSEEINGEEGRIGVKRVLEFEEFDKSCEEDQKNAFESEEESNGFSVENESGEEETHSKKRRPNDSGFDDNSTASTGKRGEKLERRNRLKELRVESQRLLRETRDASFKPVPLVQKPISSILEKIRKRKLEVAKKSIVESRSTLLDDNDAFSIEDTVDFDVEIEYHKVAKTDNVNRKVCTGESKSSGSKDDFDQRHENAASPRASVEESKQKFRAPIDDTQDLALDSEKGDSLEELPDETPSSPLEEDMAPSVLAMNLKLDSASLHELYDEEDNDKENVDPLLHGSVGFCSTPVGDPVKAFVDEEAEEEDDSDNDLGRFQDDEEDEDNTDSEELKDMITQYEEKPADEEMRTELHQKWLEQQDAAGTENLIQKLRCGSKQGDKTLLEDTENEESEEDEDLFDNEPESVVPRNIVRMNMKKAKEMISQMFTDKNDIYQSSDDEETENRLVKERLSNEAEEQTTFLSPAEDRGSREIFGLIKKLNDAPDNRRRARITPSFHMLSIGGSRISSSKASFLSRSNKNSVPSLNKHGSGNVRSFVFERDDSRSSASPSEESSVEIQTQNRSRKTTLARFSGTQLGSDSSQNPKNGRQTKSGPSLHEILRCPSLKSSNFNRGTVIGHVEAIYAAFKLDKNLPKKDSSVSIRTM